MFFRTIGARALMTLGVAAAGSNAAAREYSYQVIKVAPLDGGTAVALNNNGMVLGNFGGTEGKPSGVFTWQAGTVIKYRGASITAYGLNDAGDFVGAYGAYAFIYSAGAYNTFLYPGSASSAATGINNTGTVVGNYVSSGGYPDEHFGFQYLNNTFKSLGANLPVAISQRGDMAGEGNPEEEQYFGEFLTSNDQRTCIALGCGQSTATAINDKGVVVGEAGSNGSLIFENGMTTYIESSSCAAGATLFTGINNAGDIVGACTDGSAPFVYHHGVFENLKTVRGQVLQPIAINNHGQILANTAGGFAVLATPK